MTLYTHTLDSVGQPNKTNFTIITFFDWMLEHGIKELNKIYFKYSLD